MTKGKHFTLSEITVLHSSTQLLKAKVPPWGIGLIRKLYAFPWVWNAWKSLFSLGIDFLTQYCYHIYIKEFSLKWIYEIGKGYLLSPRGDGLNRWTQKRQRFQIVLADPIIFFVKNFLTFTKIACTGQFLNRPSRLGSKSSPVVFKEYPLLKTSF